MRPISKLWLGTFAAAVLALNFATPLEAQARWTRRIATRANSSKTFQTQSACYDSRRQRIVCVDVEQVLSKNSQRYFLSEIRGTARREIAALPVPKPQFVYLGYDRVRDVIVAKIYAPSGNFTWEWNTMAWTKRNALSRNTGSAARSLHFDARTQRLVDIFVDSPRKNFAVHAYFNGAWTVRPTTNTAFNLDLWSVRYAVDDVGRILLYVVYYDPTLKVFTSETRLLTGTNWTTVPTIPGSVYVDAAMCFDTSRRRFVLHGGYTIGQSRASSNGTWEWNGSWSLPSAGELLATRDRHELIFDGTSSVLVGGRWTTPRLIGLMDDVLAYAPPKPATSESFGSSCGAVGYFGTLVTTRKPWLGGEARFEVVGAASAQGYALSVGASKSSWGMLTLPLDLSAAGMTGCKLYASLDLVLPAAAQIRYSIPRSTSLVGVRYFHQAALFGSGANGAGVSWSNAVELRIGEP